MKPGQMRWAGHDARMREIRTAQVFNIFVGIHQGKIALEDVNGKKINLKCI
jgi:hypothetical protein